MHTVTFSQDLMEQGHDLGSLNVTLAAIGQSGAATFRAERWWQYSPGRYQYQIAAGDTLAALAALYLDNGGRWAEIWNLQDASRTQGGSPDQIFADEWMEMPPEAGENAKAWNGGTIPTKGTNGGGGGGGGKEIVEPMSSNKKTVLVLGAGAAALLVLYLATR